MAPRAFRFLAVLACVSASAGNIATDSTFAGRQQLLNGPGSVAIPDTLGARRGGNLFHSFEIFDLARGDVATFTQTQSGTISSIFARVTGGAASYIDGKIASAIPGASLYFFNSNGITFGPSAKIDIDGTFAISTADKLNFADGAEFFAKAPIAGDSLTAADIRSFGFLGNSPAELVFSSPHLLAKPGRDITAVGGGIRIERGADLPRPHVPPGATLTAPGGRITLTSVATAGSVALDGKVTATGPRARRAPGISLTESSIDTSGARGGAITIRAPKLTLSQSTIGSDTTGAGTGGTVQLAISGNLKLADSGSSIGTKTTGAGIAGAVKVSAGSIRITDDGFLGSAATPESLKGGAAGRVSIRAGRLTLAGGGRVSSTTGGAANAGAVDVSVTGALSLDGRGSPLPTAIVADTTMFSQSGRGGRGGDVRVRAGQLSVEHGARIGSTTLGDGRGGNVSISADSLRIAKGGRVEANTGAILSSGFVGGSGHGGDIAIHAGTLSLDGANDARGTGIFANNDSLNARAIGGNIGVDAGTLSILDGGLITTRLTGPGRAGDVAVSARDISIVRGTSELVTGIAADTALPTSGIGGNVRVVAGRVAVRDGGQISSFTAGVGAGGNVSIAADELTIIGGALPSVIGTESQSPGLGGDGGKVTISADKLTIRSGGRISASTFGAGAAGDVTVRAGDIFISQGESIEGTGILSESVSTTQPGKGGSVWVDADKLTLEKGGRISAGTFGPGDGGDVTVTAHDAFFSSRGSDLLTGLLAASRSQTAAGKGGNVRAKFDHLQLTGGSISATTAGPGAGGSVFVETGDIALHEASSIAASATGTGAAGSVAVTSATTIALRDSSITVKSAQSDAGSIRLLAPERITLVNSTILAEAGLNGGDVFIDPEFVILDHSLISANAILGAGGNITLIADTFLASESAVTASSEASVQGTIDIQSPDAQLANALTALPGGFLGIEIKLTDRCPMRLSSELSSFLVIGRGGLPPAPEDLR